MLSAFAGIVLATIIGPIGSETPHEPQLASSGSLVVMTFGAGNAVYFSRSQDSGRSFSMPVKVGDAPILPLTRHRGPRIVISGNAIVISAVMGRTPSQEQHAHGLPSDGDLMVWRSVDGGKSWSYGIVVNDVPGAPSEGLHALAASENGTLFATWLDKRGGHGTKLYGALSKDGGATWSKNVLIYESPEGTICECCHPSAAIAPTGEIEVMFRNCLGGLRDMYLSRSQDGTNFSRPEKLGTGAWYLNACPMDGGGLAVAGERTFTAWRRENKLFLAEPGQEEKEIGAGKDIAVATNGRRIYAIWSGMNGITLWESGKVAVLAKQGTYPTMSALPDGGMVAAWEQNGVIEIHLVNRN